MQPKGEANTKAKLTTRHVRAMRRLYAGGCPISIIARDYYVTRQNVRAIVLRQTWRHI